MCARLTPGVSWQSPALPNSIHIYMCTIPNTYIHNTRVYIHLHVPLARQAHRDIVSAVLQIYFGQFSIRSLGSDSIFRRITHTKHLVIHV